MYIFDTHDKNLSIAHLCLYSFLTIETRPWRGCRTYNFIALEFELNTRQRDVYMYIFYLSVTFHGSHKYTNANIKFRLYRVSKSKVSISNYCGFTIYKHKIIIYISLELQ